jgi:hypothetical protein
MADHDLVNAVPKRIETGLVGAGVDLGPLTVAQNEDVQVCELPLGAVLLEILATSNAAIGPVDFGIEGANVTNDVDAFGDAVVLTAGITARGNLLLPYIAATVGEYVTFRPTAVAGIAAVDTGRVIAVYSMDAFVDGTNTGLQDS